MSAPSWLGYFDIVLNMSARGSAKADVCVIAVQVGKLRFILYLCLAAYTLLQFQISCARLLV
jgi:hypothetical protein